mmetsp:Transcript_58769/g.68670  ORF Transcript_58769/g.68670 Transcript_58769/m.68670 type:complete len:112 (-) Transcript_58769:245-580(-)
MGHQDSLQGVTREISGGTRRVNVTGGERPGGGALSSVQAFFDNGGLQRLASRGGPATEGIGSRLRGEDRDGRIGLVGGTGRGSKGSLEGSEQERAFEARVVTADLGLDFVE